MSLSDFIVPSLCKRVVHLRGVVPFEIKKWNMKDTLNRIDILQI